MSASAAYHAGVFPSASFAGESPADTSPDQCTRTFCVNDDATFCVTGNGKFYSGTHGSVSAAIDANATYSWLATECGIHCFEWHLARRSDNVLDSW